MNDWRSCFKSKGKRGWSHKGNSAFLLPSPEDSRVSKTWHTVSVQRATSLPEYSVSWSPLQTMWWRWCAFPPSEFHNSLPSHALRELKGRDWTSILCWSPQEPFLSYIQVCLLGQITFHILSSISPAGSHAGEFINSSKAAPLSSTVMPSVGGGSYMGSLYCRMAPDPSDPIRPLRSLCLWTEQNQTILWMGSSVGPNEPKWRLGRWDHWSISYRWHTWTPIKVFSFWLDWEGEKLVCGDLGERGQSWKYWRRWYVSLAVPDITSWGALERWWGERQKSESLVCLCEVVLAQGPGDRQGTELVRGSLSFPLWSALKLQQFGVAWRGHGTIWHTGKPRTQCLWRAAFFPRSSGNWHSRCWTELWGSSCPQWVQTSPWAPVRQPSQLGEGGRVGLEKYNSVIIRELQDQGNSGINIIMALFCMCSLVRPVYSGSSWVQTANSIVKAGWLRSTYFRSWN